MGIAFLILQIELSYSLMNSTNKMTYVKDSKVLCKEQCYFVFINVENMEL